MTIDQLHDSFRLFIRETLGLPANSVRVANQNAPTGDNTPIDFFITVLFSNIVETGWDSHSEEPIIVSSVAIDQVTEIVKGQRILTTSIQFFGENAVNYASRLKTLLTMSKASTKLKTLGLGFVKSSPVRDLSVEVNTYFEPRAQMDLQFHVVARETDILETYGQFPIELQTENILTNSEVFEP